MKFLFASDSFKGTLSSSDTIRLLTKACQNVLPGSVTCGVPVADGGEGTMEAVVLARHGEIREYLVEDPLGRPVHGQYGHLSDTQAIFEMASCSGLPLLKEAERNPLYTSTYGTGQLLGHLMDEGYTDITIAIGGSATNDGGIGALRALGIRFLDEKGNILPGRGIDLERINRIDLTHMTPLIAKTQITVLCDVTNPLTGLDGATNTFGKQKGGTPDILARLEKGMCHYRDVLKKTYHINADEIAGTGAAGGLGAALSICLHAKMKSGIETVLDLINFDAYLKDVDYVITGEGRTDWQSAYGKVVMGVAKRAAGFNIPVIDLCGCLGDGYEQLSQYGVNRFITTAKKDMPLTYALEHAEELYYERAVEMFEDLK